MKNSRSTPMAFKLRDKPLATILATLAQRGGELVSVRQEKSPKKYRVELTAHVHGSEQRWCSPYIKCPKGRNTGRDWAAEDRFAATWRPSFSSGNVPHTDASAGEAEAAPPREKRPRDCRHAAASTEDAPAAKVGGARPGSGRPKGSYGWKRVREAAQQLNDYIERGQPHCALIASRDLPGDMLDAVKEVHQHQEVWGPAFLKRQSNRGVGRKEALRKLAKHRSQLEKAAAASAACRSGWERGQDYFRAVIKECQSAVAATSAGLNESVLVSHAQAGSLQFKALALKAVYHKLLKGAPKRQAFEDTAEFFEVADSTLREWELSYRTKGHIQMDQKGKHERRATRMNAGYGGVRKGAQLAAQNATTLLADTPKLKKGTVQHLTFQEGECPFYDPDATDHIGKVKGLKQILFERGLWNADMSMKGIRKGQQEYDPALCMPAVLGAQEDFANVEPSLMVLVKRHGGVAIMLPKFHCEINPIELVWGRSKYWVRKHCKYTIACLRTNVSKSYAVAEDRLSLAIVQKFCRTVANFNEVYRDGLKGAEAVQKRDTFKSHRKPAPSEYINPK
ncbi:unnamed protein product [Ectocarpus sp. CCAP 1310/34]|nr:unnamed protein product [Ectocarpus sp. CCAP 1310/34]